MDSHKAPLPADSKDIDDPLTVLGAAIHEESSEGMS